MRKRVVLSRRWPGDVEARLEERYELVTNPDDQPFDARTMVEALCTADAVGVTVTDSISRDIIESALNRGLRARILGNFGVGYNHINIAAAHSAGLVVTNTPGVLTDATADLAMALLLATARRLGEGERLVRAGQWDGWAPTQLLGRSVSGARLAIVGAGRIGRAVAQRAIAGFGMQVRYTGRREIPQQDLPPMIAGMRFESDLHALLEWADFVSLHCPATPATRHLINAAALAAIGPKGCLINTARGDVVDERALIAALESGQLGAAGLDVYAAEPRVPDALIALEHVVLAPHLGSATIETRSAMGHRVVDNLDAFFADQKAPDVVT